MSARFLFSLLFAFALVSCNNKKSDDADDDKENTTTGSSALPQVKEEAVSYTSDSSTHKGYIAYDTKKEGKLPVVLVVHEWWGLTDYPRSRARQLAELGYFAMAVDMYGNGQTADTPEGAMKLAGPFYMNPGLAKLRIDAALAKAGEYPQADVGNAAAIGYCYGGYVVLNSAKLGSELKGVVNFHGNLSGAPVDKNKLKAAVLVCHGAADSLVPSAEVAAFRKSMDSIGANYQFNAYPGAKHAFTNPGATETGQRLKMPVEYNAAADSSSWNEMKSFLSTVLNKK
jgi:dienelactone hydrolase